MLIKNIPHGQSQRICIGSTVAFEIHVNLNGKVRVAIEAPKDMPITMNGKDEPKPVV